MHLIPRVKVNYSFADLFNAFWISERKKTHTNRLILALSELYGTQNLMLTASGRGSLYLILRSLPQRRVVIPAYTCMAVVEATLLAGKEIRYVECNNTSFNADGFDGLDGDSIVIATHQYGLPCDIEKIALTCKKAGSVLIEDCAGAMGTMISGRHVGTFGDFGFFSFDSSKLINVPSKGGFIIARKHEALKKIQEASELCSSNYMFKLKHLGLGLVYTVLKPSLLYSAFHYFTMGRKRQLQLENHNTPNLSLTDFYRYGFSEWQAYIASKQIDKIKLIIEKRKVVYEYYDKYIQNYRVRKPVLNEDAVCIRYAIRVPQRDDFYWSCVNNGVDAGFSFRNIAAPESFKHSHQMADEVLNLPFYYDISEKEMAKVVKVINSIV